MERVGWAQVGGRESGGPRVGVLPLVSWVVMFSEAVVLFIQTTSISPVVVPSLFFPGCRVPVNVIKLGCLTPLSKSF